MRWCRWLLLLPLLSNCAAPERTCVAGQPATTVQLLFGRTAKGGGSIGDVEWRRFLAEVVTPRFPDGLTVLDGTGQWRQRSSGRVVSEPSTVVMIVTDSAPATLASIEVIRADYRRWFDQESVGLVVNEACAAF